jgi:hypothetical protein
LHSLGLIPLFPLRSQDGEFTLNDTNVNNYMFELNTDASGAIDYWRVLLSTPEGLQIATYGPGPGSYDAGVIASSDITQPPTYYAGNVNNPGTWSVPKPSSLILLGVGLLALYGSRRKDQTKSV